MKKISVVGAGFAGLTLSLRLAEAGFEVDLYEKSARVGGLIGTEKSSFGLAEHAANALIKTPRAEKLFRDLDLEPYSPLPESKKRFILRGRPRTMPLSIWELMTFIGRVLPRFIFNRESLKPRPEQKLKDWGYEKLGRAGTDYLLEPAMQGIYAQGISKLSASLIIGPLFKKNREAYKGMLSGAEGFQSLIDGLEKAVRARGVRIHLNHEVRLSELSGPVVLATSGGAAANLTAETQPELHAVLKRIHMGSLVSAKVFFDEPQEDVKGFGVLIPRAEGEFKTLGVLLNPFIFAGRNQTYNETWILGGDKVADVLKMSDDEIIQLITEERSRILNRRDAVTYSKIDRWSAALPIYDVDLEKCLSEIQLPPDFYLHGNYLGGLGLSKILERGDQLVERLQERYG